MKCLVSVASPVVSLCPYPKRISNRRTGETGAHTVRHEAAKVATDNAVPRWALAVVELSCAMLAFQPSGIVVSR
jgi:hypothetical protein